MAPSCFALQVPDVRGLQVPVGTRLRTVLVSLDLSRFRACPRNHFLKVKTGTVMAYGPDMQYANTVWEDLGHGISCHMR